MIQFKPLVRERLEALADFVEIHNEGALRGLNKFAPFTQSQAETYLRFYNGYKREIQEQALESGLIDPDDPLFGWGWIAQHEPSVRLIDEARHLDTPLSAQDVQDKTLSQKQQQSAELHVVKHNYIVATLPMSILHATVAPTIVPNVTRAVVVSRMQRVRNQIESPGLLEKLNQLRCYTIAKGVEIRATGKIDYQIGLIN